MDEEQGSVVQNTSRENRKQSSNTLKSDTFAAWTFYLWTSRDRCKLCECVYTHIYIYVDLDGDWYEERVVVTAEEERSTNGVNE